MHFAEIITAVVRRLGILDELPCSSYTHAHQCSAKHKRSITNRLTWGSEEHAGLLQITTGGKDNCAGQTESGNLGPKKKGEERFKQEAWHSRKLLLGQKTK